MRTTRLVIELREGHSVQIGDCRVTIKRSSPTKSSLLIEAPESVQVVRDNAKRKKGQAGNE